ncbi:hypothetical protein DM02DRAFT_45351 [Periconia macrospinosa]|uniref:Uncharacterized protein n=1 Tax=Periconia macrospinosa TaxID=97972 RepID=A0A2V1DKV4_9PLEO|nr:hypothetical protein DM02DRAFT_45351 [Periconia macrospinosa]
MPFDRQARLETLHLMKPRCRVCARALRTTMDNFVDRLCMDHDKSSTTTEAVLGRICIGIQDALEDRLRLTMWSRWEPYPSHLSSEQHWWWKRMMIFSDMCRISFDYLWHLVIPHIIDSPVVPVARVREIEFCTAQYYGYWHCAYVITLQDGSFYVFDPTGVQFGPQWPLLAPLDVYEFRMHRPWQFRVFQVGHYYETRERDDSHEALIKSRFKSWDLVRFKLGILPRVEEEE